MTNPVVYTGLQLKYQTLWGRTFYATYQGESYIPQTGTGPIARDVLSIVEEDTFTSVLREISNDVLREPYGQQVWKAITVPEDVPGQNDYKLLVEPGLSVSGVVPLQPPHRFRVDTCTPFTLEGDPFSHGVNIKVSVLPPA